VADALRGLLAKSVVSHWGIAGRGHPPGLPECRAAAEALLRAGTDTATDSSSSTSVGSSSTARRSDGLSRQRNPCQHNRQQCKGRYRTPGNAMSTSGRDKRELLGLRSSSVGSSTSGGRPNLSTGTGTGTGAATGVGAAAWAGSGVGADGGLDAAASHIVWPGLIPPLLRRRAKRALLKGHFCGPPAAPVVRAASAAAAPDGAGAPPGGGGARARGGAGAAAHGHPGAGHPRVLQPQPLPLPARPSRAAAARQGHPGTGATGIPGAARGGADAAKSGPAAGGGALGEAGSFQEALLQYQRALKGDREEGEEGEEEEGGVCGGQCGGREGWKGSRGGCRHRGEEEWRGQR